ncbi:transcriptional regulator, ArsR family [Thermoanaerobacter italicus Ab9]|uniref:Transcriptional regulator, ArsR family n=1 Tax=Thermoanaerobacter italicus (strain DSM 9252 / Ab9) TaxID=580331 RepID=D3T6F4_THEIA|nr:metalloregulator ArsR/SmtB family transcription factor [Thermoanaerobacter italicus]ADD03548.1 transcriptional regulator, ArsR family [Thermoanaerobacter italicus Ab9]
MELLLVLKAMADESRLKILKTLLQQDCCVMALSQKLGISEAAVSQHLKVLKEANLVSGERKGYFMHYSINRETLHQLACEIISLASLESCSCNHEKAENATHDLEKCGVHNEQQRCRYKKEDRKPKGDAQHDGNS